MTWDYWLLVIHAVSFVWCMISVHQDEDITIGFMLGMLTVPEILVFWDIFDNILDIVIIKKRIIK